MIPKIYTLRCPTTGKVRYVGKCVDLKSRLRQHISEARLGIVQSHKCCWIRSLLAQGLKPVMAVDCIVEAGDDWKRVEVERVAHYRSLGCDLTNGTDGGDEPGELTEEGRAFLSRLASQRFGTPDGRAAQSQRMRQLCADPEWVARRHAAGKATRATAEYKAAHSSRMKAVAARPGQKERRCAARKQVASRPEYREKLSNATAEAMKDGSRRAAIAEHVRRRWADPVHRAMRVAAIRSAVGKESQA